MYFPRLERVNGSLVDFKLVPLRISRFQLHRATTEEADWLQQTLDRESARFGTRVSRSEDGSLVVRWR
jgi:poly-gamma-glutamate capsule biosynthesis protein CapA/YwtB (metallophosphatase superfamily)